MYKERQTEKDIRRYQKFNIAIQISESPFPPKNKKTNS